MPGRETTERDAGLAGSRRVANRSAAPREPDAGRHESRKIPLWNGLRFSREREARKSRRRYLFGTQNGYSDKQLVHVVKVDSSTPLGPI